MIIKSALEMIWFKVSFSLNAPAAFCSFYDPKTMGIKKQNRKVEI